MLPFILLSLVFASALSSSVPVLLWESSSLSEKEDLVPALNFMDTDDFSNHLVNKIHALKPLIVLFVEPTLSVEDFSWQDDSRHGAFTQVQNLTGMAAKVEFMPSVQDPVAAIKDLVVSHGYSYAKYDNTKPRTKPSTILEVTLSDPLTSEDRPALLRRHDSSIARVYSDLLASSPRIVAVYTGRQSSWVEADALNRVRRAADNDSSSVMYNTKDLRVETSSEPILEVDGNKTVLKGTADVKSDSRANYSRAIVTYMINNEKIVLRFRFSHDNRKFPPSPLLLDLPLADKSYVLIYSCLPLTMQTFGLGRIGFWKIDLVELERGSSKMIPLYPPETEKWIPLGTSFKTLNPYVFQNDSVKLIFENFQAEKFRRGQEGTFSKALTAEDQTVFFTPAIWMGIVVMFVLGSILAWGISMLLDIKTMDRFDDPKGKTITVTAVE